MKKVILILVLVLTLSLALVACDDNTPETPVSDHQIVMDKAVPATCVETGLTEGKHCSVCNTIIVAQETIEALGHKYDSDCDKACNVCSAERETTASHIDINPIDNSCDLCNAVVDSITFTLSDDGTSYIISGANDSVSGDITIPSTYKNKPVTTIGYSAFEDCDNLTSIVIPDSVTTIGSDAFYGCESLTSITVNEDNANYKSIDGNLYSKDGTIIIKYPIGKSNTTFEIPEGVTTVGDNAFYDCYNLTSIVIPDSVIDIEHGAFCGSTNLTSVTIGDGVATIGDQAFYTCFSLTNITVDENNPNFKSIDGNLYSKDGTILIQYSIGKSNTTFEIPDGVTTIGEFAFSSGVNLTSIAIPDSVTAIGDGAFSGCFNLKNIVIPDGVTTIGGVTFHFCINLTSIEIPNSVTTIGYSAFEECDGLRNVYFTGTKEQWDAIDMDFNNEDLNNATIHYNYVPEE